MKDPGEGVLYGEQHMPRSQCFVKWNGVSVTTVPEVGADSEGQHPGPGTMLGIDSVLSCHPNSTERSLSSLFR